MKVLSVIGMLALLAAGCSRDPASLKAEREDRASRAYAAAMGEFEAGRLAQAQRGFEAVIRDDPGNANARFQLATIYAQDARDLLGAIANYREYALLRPASDKAAIARERRARCEALYAAEVASRGTLVISLTNRLATLQREHEGCLKRIAEADARAKDADERARKAELAVIMKSRLLAAASKDDDPLKTPTKINPTEAELLDTEDDGTRLKKSDVAALKAELDAEERRDVSNAFAKVETVSSNAVPFASRRTKKKDPFARPETYVVQEGDTLMKLALRFYGVKNKWRAIRDANRAEVSTDGRIRAGQTLRLPE